MVLTVIALALALALGLVLGLALVHVCALVLGLVLRLALLHVRALALALDPASPAGLSTAAGVPWTALAPDPFVRAMAAALPRPLAAGHFQNWVDRREVPIEILKSWATHKHKYVLVTNMYVHTNRN